MAIEAAVAPVAAVAPAMTEGLSAAGSAGIEAGAGSLANVGGEIGGGLAPEVANLTAEVGSSIDTTPLSGIQAVANVEVPGMPSVSAEAPAASAGQGLEAAGAASPVTPIEGSTPPETDKLKTAAELASAGKVAWETNPEGGKSPVGPVEGGSGSETSGDGSKTNAEGANPTEDSADATSDASKTTEAGSPNETPHYALTDQDQQLLDLEKSGGPMTPDQQQALKDLHTRIDEKTGTTPDGESSKDGSKTPDGGKGPEAPADKVDTTDTPADSKDNDPKQAEKAKRQAELEQKIKDGNATADEIKEYREGKKDPAQRKKDLEQKALDGTITDQEAEELGKMNKDAENKPAKKEQTAEELSEETDKLAADLMNKMANGEQLTPQDYENLRALREKLLAKQFKGEGLTPEDAKAVIEKVMHGKGNEKQIMAVKEIQQKIQELMGIELQMRSMPKNVAFLRGDRDREKRRADAAHRDANNALGETRAKKKQEEYQAYMQIANINAQIVKIKYMVPVLDARRTDLEQEIRRKVGVSSGIGAVMEWGGAQLKNIYTDVGVGIAEEFDYRTGNF